MAHAQKPDFVLLRLKCDGTCAENRFRLSAKRTSPFKSAGGRQFSHLQTVTIPEAAYIQLRRRPPEDKQGNARKM